MTDAITRYIPVNSKGAPDVDAVASAEIEVRRLIAEGGRTVIAPVHGWTVTASRFMVDVDCTATGLRPYLNLGECLLLPIHWKASVNDDEESAAQLFDPFRFYAMRDRADQVGATALAPILNALIDAANNIKGGLRFILIGHSFGCRVVCSCLNALAKAGGENGLRGSTCDAINFQGALNNDALEPGNLYGDVHRLERTRLLVTRSKLDRALCDAFYYASGLSHAIGDTGATPLTWRTFGGAMTDADIEPIQRKYPDGNRGVAGSHSNFKLPEIFQVVGQFLSQPVNP